MNDSLDEILRPESDSPDKNQKGTRLGKYRFIFLAISLALLWFNFKAFEELFAILNRDFKALAITLVDEDYSYLISEAKMNFFAVFSLLYVIFLITIVSLWATFKSFNTSSLDMRISRALLLFIFGPIILMVFADIFYSI